MLRSNSSRGCGGGGRPGAVPGRPSPAPSLTCSSSEPLARGLPPFPLGHQLAGPGQEQPAGPLGSHGRCSALPGGSVTPPSSLPHPLSRHASSGPSMAICPSLLPYPPRSLERHRGPLCFLCPARCLAEAVLHVGRKELMDVMSSGERGRQGIIGAGFLCQSVCTQVRLGPFQPN